MDWSYDEDYTKDTMLGAAAQRVEARQRFEIDVARPNVAGLVKAGVEVSSDRRTRRNDSSGGGAYFRRDLQRNGEGVDARASLHISFRLDGSATSEVSLPGTMRSILPSAVGANISAIPYRRDPEVRYLGIFRVCGYTAWGCILHD